MSNTANQTPEKSNAKPAESAKVSSSPDSKKDAGATAQKSSEVKSGQAQQQGKPGQPRDAGKDKSAP